MNETAKRGMVLVHHETRRDFVIGQPLTEREEYTIGLVTSVTRDGMVKRFRTVAYGDVAAWSDYDQAGPAEPKRFQGSVLLAADVDPALALAAAKAHHWPGHPTQPMPFATLDEVRETLRPCRKA